ncbi:uncharacterized protein LOC134240673 [Saccostrea cucullata]|uniref:uncharacterized protein LOC134240673 n=1 Tax=Saccostrea cuccullata TaxID=36930 RepID=UPI002ED3D6C6
MLLRCTILFAMYYARQIAVGIETQEYIFGKDCVNFEEVNEDRQIHLDYRGQTVSSCPYMSFQEKGKQTSYEYQVCVSPTWFQDFFCSVEIVFKSGYNGKKLKSFTCSSSYSNLTFCADVGDPLYVNFDPQNGKSTHSVSFRFLITASRLGFTDLVLGSIGGAFAGILMLAFVVAFFCWCVCIRKLTTSQSEQTTSSSVTTQPACTYMYVTSTAQPTGNIDLSSATTYSAQNSTLYGTQPSFLSSQSVEWQQTQKQTSFPT